MEAISDFNIRIESLQDDIEEINVDIHGTNRIDANYLRQLEETAFSVISNFVTLLMEFQEYFNFELVRADMLLHMHKAIQLVGFCRLECLLPGVMDCQIEKIVYEIFQKLGKPVPQVSSAKGLKSLIHAFQKEKVKKQLNDVKWLRDQLLLRSEIHVHKY